MVEFSSTCSVIAWPAAACRYCSSLKLAPRLCRYRIVCVKPRTTARERAKAEVAQASLVQPYLVPHPYF